VEIETEELEDLLENQPNFLTYTGARGFRTARTGGYRHVEGVLDGTDVAGNVGFAEGSMMHTDEGNFPDHQGNTNSVASHAQAQLLHNGFSHNVKSSGLFRPNANMQRVLIIRSHGLQDKAYGSVQM